MESKLFDMIEKTRLYDLRDKIEKMDEIGDIERVRKAEETLAATLNDEQKQQLKHLELAIENKMDYLYYEVQVYLTNIAFRMGMEMQRSFDEEDFQ